MIRTCFAAAVLTLAILTPALAADEWDISTCVGPDAAQSVDACTRIINDKATSQEDLGKAYGARGNSYQKLNKYDQAITDYDAAIKLDQKNASLYVNRGHALQAKGDLDKALADQDEAIKLDPKNRSAYVNRGDVFAAKGEYAKAVADYDAAIKIDPKDAVAYLDRGNARNADGKYEAAVADFDAAVQLLPKYPMGYFSRGFAHLYAGSLPKALADFKQAVALDPKDPYLALWLTIAGQRSKEKSDLAKLSQNFDMKSWPAPVVQFYLHKLNASALLAAANDADPAVQQGRLCEANFYSGEEALQRGAKDDAERRFRSAATDCPKSFNEWVAAKAELKALGKPL